MHSFNNIYFTNNLLLLVSSLPSDQVENTVKFIVMTLCENRLHVAIY